jgi:hypothetical protein
MFRMFFGSALLLAASPSSVAQAQSGSRIDPTRNAVRHQDVGDPAAAQRVLHAYAACVVRERPAWAEAMIALPYRTPEQDSAVRRSQTGQQDCMGYSGLELRFSAHILVGAMAERLLETRYRSASLERASQPSEPEIAAGPLAPRNMLEDVAICVVRRNPVAIRTLLGTAAGTPAELAAAQGFAGDLEPCASNGQRVTFGVPSLRSLLAVALFRVLSTPSDSIAAAAARPH